ncbi:hypothetical protein C0J52_25551 [Blattella germanica]|nr:hypothetical protein C0J52_25551 [Blattella germanica]
MIPAEWKRAVRIIDGASSRCHSRPLFIKYSILTIPSMYIMSCLLYAKNNLVVKHLPVNKFRAQLRSTLTANPLYKLDEFFYIVW